MDHSDHVYLLSKGVSSNDSTWADFGSGGGAFTLALAELLGSSGQIHSIDADRSALARQQRSLAASFPDRVLHTYNADFTQPLDLPPLDGLVVANALHFLPQKDATVQRLMSYLRPGGSFLIVEYDTDRGNRWVPHPFTFEQWRGIAQRSGLERTELLAVAPSSFLGGFYSAMNRKPEI